ncbi:MAG: HvfA family oxazolone/thioamide-modified RiPP metallophore [Gammaproteobacteria bacterium]
MSNKRKFAPFVIAAGAVLTASAAAIPAANAGQNPFGMTALSSGYMAAGAHGDVVRFADGKCGSEKKKEGKCGEGKCGEK